jgi:hypothetical protein
MSSCNHNNELKCIASLWEAFRTHLGFYGQRRINVSHIYSDNERDIASLAPQFAGAGIQLTHCGSGMHVHIVERAIRYIEEGVRSVLAGLPYPSPRILFHHLIPFTAQRLNLFPTSTRTDNVSAFLVVYNRPAQADIVCQLSYGAIYDVVHLTIIGSQCVLEQGGCILLEMR